VLSIPFQGTKEKKYKTLLFGKWQRENESEAMLEYTLYSMMVSAGRLNVTLKTGCLHRELYCVEAVKHGY